MGPVPTQQTGTELTLLLHPDGSLTELRLSTDHSSLPLMHAALGGQHLDATPLTGHIDMWTSAEAQQTRALNEPATALASLCVQPARAYHGPVLLAGVDDDGNSVDLDTAQAAALLTRLADAASADAGDGNR